MADPEDRYSENESLDRILRVLKGGTIPEAPESLVPPKRSSNESLSMIAELLNGTLEGSQAIIPTGLNSYGMIFVNAVTSGHALASGTWTYVRLATGTEIYNVTEAHDDTTGHLLTVSNDGHYLLGYNLSFAGTKDAEYEFAIRRGTAGVDRAVPCPRCAKIQKEADLVVDGYTRGLVCPACYEPPPEPPQRVWPFR